MRPIGDWDISEKDILVLQELFLVNVLKSPSGLKL